LGAPKIIKQLNNFGDSVTYNSGELLIGTENIRLIIVVFMCSVSKMSRTNIFKLCELELIPDCTCQKAQGNTHFSIQCRR